MTREEAKQWLESIKKKYIHGGDEEFDYKRKVALDMAIKALEQEPVLDKLRAEIENHCGLAKENHCRYCYDCHHLMGVREILEVIDEYKAESEPQESENKE